MFIGISKINLHLCIQASTNTFLSPTKESNYAETTRNIENLINLSENLEYSKQKSKGFVIALLIIGILFLITGMTVLLINSFNTKQSKTIRSNKANIFHGAFLLLMCLYLIFAIIILVNNTSDQNRTTSIMNNITTMQDTIGGLDKNKLNFESNVQDMRRTLQNIIPINDQECISSAINTVNDVNINLIAQQPINTNLSNYINKRSISDLNGSIEIYNFKNNWKNILDAMNNLNLMDLMALDLSLKDNLTNMQKYLKVINGLFDSLLQTYMAFTNSDSASIDKVNYTVNNISNLLTQFQTYIASNASFYDIYIMFQNINQNLQVFCQNLSQNQNTQSTWDAFIDLINKNLIIDKSFIQAFQAKFINTSFFPTTIINAPNSNGDPSVVTLKEICISIPNVLKNAGIDPATASLDQIEAGLVAINNSIMENGSILNNIGNTLQSSDWTAINTALSNTISMFKYFGGTTFSLGDYISSKVTTSLVTSFNNSFNDYNSLLEAIRQYPAVQNTDKLTDMQVFTNALNLILNDVTYIINLYNQKITSLQALDFDTTILSDSLTSAKTTNNHLMSYSLNFLLNNLANSLLFKADSQNMLTSNYTPKTFIDNADILKYLDVSTLIDKAKTLNSNMINLEQINNYFLDLINVSKTKRGIIQFHNQNILLYIDNLNIFISKTKEFLQNVQKRIRSLSTSKLVSITPNSSTDWSGVISKINSFTANIKENDTYITDVSSTVPFTQLVSNHYRLSVSAYICSILNSKVGYWMLFYTTRHSLGSNDLKSVVKSSDGLKYLFEIPTLQGSDLIMAAFGNNPQYDARSIFFQGLYYNQDLSNFIKANNIPVQFNIFHELVGVSN